MKHVAWFAVVALAFVGAFNLGLLVSYQHYESALTEWKQVAEGAVSQSERAIQLISSHCAERSLSTEPMPYEGAPDTTRPDCVPFQQGMDIPAGGCATITIDVPPPGREEKRR